MAWAVQAEEDPFRVTFSYGDTAVVVYFGEDGLWHAEAADRAASSLFLDYAIAEALDVSTVDAIRAATAVLSRLPAGV